MANTRQPKEVSGEKYKELVRAQYDDLYQNHVLAIDPSVKRLLLPQTIHGRAMMGHGSFFNGLAKPNISMEEILEAIGLDPLEVRASRQKMMEDFLFCVDDLIDGKINRFVDREGKPIYGINFLEDYKLEIDKEFFKGGALVGRMDSPLWRERTKLAHSLNLRNKPFKIGYGEELPIDVEKMRENNFSFTQFSDYPHTLESLTHLRAKGIIVPQEELSTRGFENHFVRYSQGLGICDDAALIATGLIHGPYAMIFGFLVDATDTYTKFCQNRVAGGFDEFIGAHLEERYEEKYGEKLVSDKETRDIIYLGGKDTLEIPEIFSSSHKRLLQHEESKRKGTIQAKPTILNHHRFVTHGESQDFELGFTRCHSLVFYENIRERFRKTGRQYYLPKRTPPSK